MNVEAVVVQGSKNLKCTFNGKKYLIGIPFIPKSELETFEKASKYLHKAFIVQNPSVHEEDLNEYMDKVGGSRLKRLSKAEKEKRISIRNKALDSLLRVSIDKVRYKDHLTEDPCNLRFVAYKMMHRTPVKEADLQYNQRITDLMIRAKNKEFADDKELDIQTKKDKEELLGHFRKMLKGVENFDLEEFTSKEWTDEELAEHAGEIFTLNSLLTDFDDVPGNLASNFGIKDPKCERIIENYSRYWNFSQTLNARLARITSMGYELYASENEPDFLKVMQDADHYQPNLAFSDSMQAHKTYIMGLPIYATGAAKEMFNILGVSIDDISVLNPDKPDKEPVGFYSDADVANKDGKVTFVCEKANIKLTFNIFSDELPRAMAQNKFSELIDKSIVKDPAPVEKPDEVAKPAKVGFLGKVADFFTNLSSGHKPRQEAYDSAMTRYNNYQSELKKYTDYVKGHAAYLAVKDESVAKMRLVDRLKEHEAVVDEKLRQYKIDSELERESLRFGFLNQIDDSKPQIKNDAKDLMQRELSGLEQPQINEVKQDALIDVPASLLSIPDEAVSIK